MKTLVVEQSGILSVKAVGMPTYNECQALVKTLSCGVCNGTDAKLIHGSFKGFDSDQYPLMLGHEGVGRVVETGARVTTFKKGDIVLLPFVEPMEGFKSGWGAYSEYGVVCDPVTWDSTKYGPVPECAFAQTVLPPDIDPVDAAMIITLREVLSSIKRFGIRENSSVTVFGCGPVGLTFIKFMSLLGVAPIIALDIVEEKLLVAREMGADYTFISSDSGYMQKIRDICPDGVQYVLDAVGMISLINTAMPLLADQGKICCYGIAPKSEAQINWASAPYNWQLQFQQFPSKAEEGAAHNQVMNWLRAGVIRLWDFVSDYYDFADILSAFEALEQKKISKKCIIRFPQV